MPGRRFSSIALGTPPHRPGLAAPDSRDHKLLTAVSGLSRQLARFAADVNEQLTAVNAKLHSIDERMTALEEVVNSRACVEEKRKRRAHNPKIAEAVRRFHNAKGNRKRYNPEEGLSSPHNEAVTSHLVQALAESPDLHSVARDAILSACKTYYETIRRNFRYSQPDLAAQAEAMKTAARSRQRRKRLLEARQGVLSADELDFWRGVTIDMMSDEEDGAVEGVAGWIVRPPSFRSKELTDLCATLQARLEANPKYTATHHRRLHIGPDSDRNPPNAYDPDAAKKHFKEHLIPKRAMNHHNFENNCTSYKAEELLSSPDDTDMSPLDEALAESPEHHSVDNEILRVTVA
ncbi:uncharacterized protein C14orf93 isoform X1 [Oreochromis aureus]|uniref:Uncharacterized protein n=1 Tax=Oreochromis aureus TaxID=47969 RepID=A0A668SZS6_OREAU|nr:uncharacterized protein C14orf93 isoform X1 [Oreochromis aureus]